MTAIAYPDPPLSDGVIALRPRRPEDAPDVAAFCDDPSITRFMPLPSPYRESDYFEWDRLSERERAEGRGFSLLIVDHADRAIGTLGFKHLDQPGYAEIGYLMGAPSRGKGFAARALRLARDHALHALGVERLELLIHHDNEPSQRVARAAGFAETGEYRPCPTGCTPDQPDHKVFAYPGAEEA
jgi:RimJ/RimL family protein N-acetyltransferase